MDEKPRIHIPVDTHLAMVRHARQDDPHECCGLLVGRRRATAILLERVIPAPNITKGDRSRNYQIDWKVLLSTRRNLRGGPTCIIGFYHSHPDGTFAPSPRDEHHAWSEHIYIIVPVLGGHVGVPTAWYATGESAGLIKTRVQLSGKHSSDPSTTRR